jgi:hypothetical protein
LKRSEPAGSPRSSGTAPTQIDTYWWRLILTGGTAFSRATLTKFEWEVGNGLHNPLADIEGGVVMAAGKATHLHGPSPTLGYPPPYPVSVEWTVDEVPRSRELSVFVEPWT